MTTLRRCLRAGLTGLVLASVAADAGEGPAAPRSPKAADALRVEAAAVAKAARDYWAACHKADQRLANELTSAADAAHARNDGAEEGACRSALADVSRRLGAEAVGVGGGSSAGPPPPFRFDRRR